ncbi:zinc-finger domain-containing protein [Anaplasmataceae bacterium AB001_6]|nr:zinc-finger domain-containing protein [Anaplasmataceae bacterium AB001_6]
MKNDMKNVLVSSKIVRCNGQGTSHPVVYLNIERKSRIVCPYCGIVYLKSCCIDKQTVADDKKA